MSDAPTRTRRLRLPRSLVFGLAALPGAALAVFYLWPFATLINRAASTADPMEVLGRSTTWSVVWFSLWQAVVSTVITIVVGLAPAYLTARFEFRGRAILVALLTAIFVLPTVVMGAAFRAVLPAGLDQTVWAVIAAHVVFNLAVVIRTVGVVWERLPTDLEAAAATLGAPPRRVFMEVVLPQLRPAITAAAAIIFLFTFTSFGVVRILAAPGTRTIEVEVWRQATQLGDVSAAAVLAVLQLAMLGIVVGWSARAQRRHTRTIALQPAASMDTTTGRRHVRTNRQRWIVIVIAGATTVVALAPIAALVVSSFSTPQGWSTSAWTDLDGPDVRPGLRGGVDAVDAIVTSFRSAAWATLFAVVIGGVASLAIAAAGPASRILDVGLMLPLATSAVTIGFGMLITFDTDPYDWRASWWLVPVGHALVAVPFIVRTAIGVLRAVDPEMSYAARTLGASPTRAWWETVVPHLWRPLVVGAGLAAAISLGEFGATSLLSRTGGETMPIAIDALLGRTGSQLRAQGYVLATILAAATIVIVVAVDRLRNVEDLGFSAVTLSGNTGAGAPRADRTRSATRGSAPSDDDVSDERRGT